jgi:hypothetical protein
VPRRPAHITQADVARVIRAAKQAGASEIEVRVDGCKVIVRFSQSTGVDDALEPAQEICL